MKKITFSFDVAFFFSIFIFSCTKSNQQLQQGVLSWDTLTSNHDTIYSTYYIPRTLKIRDKHQTIIFFDPQGKPENIIKTYAPLAEKYSFIFLGFNSYINGQDIQQLLQQFQRWEKHVFSHFPVDSNQIYFVGFSGGAQFASILISHGFHPRGVFLAGLFNPSILAFQGSTMLVSGLRDFNFSYFLELFLQKTPQQMHFLFFDGKHQWPDTTIFEHFLLSSHEKLPTTFVEKNIHIVNQWLAEKNYLLLFLNLPYFSTFLPPEKTQQIFKELTSTFDFDTYLRDFQKETAHQQILLKKIIDGDHAYFRQWLDSIKQLEKINRELLTTQRNERAKAYAGIVLYSLTKDAFNKKSPLLPSYLKMYEMLEPENTEMLIFKAGYFAEQRQCDTAKTLLHKAYQLGFTDKKRLYHMPEFRFCRSMLFETP